jgi:oligopeptide transport system substrate-binding protein
MRVSRRAGAVAITAAVALIAAGCSGGSDDKSTDTSSTSNAAITIYGVQPENGLVPANTTETGGGKVLDYLWTGLVKYPDDGGAPVNALADSITTSDSKVYTIKIKPNTKFHDGTVVKAENFVKAWNFDALATNNMANAPFFGDIQGFSDVNPSPTKAGAKPPAPTAKEMSGLKVVDDTTFTVTLNAPFSIFPTKLGYSAFYPLPDAFFTSTPDKFGRAPIGNGPMKFVSWTDNQDIKLTRFDDYTLPGKVSKIKDVDIKIYDQDTAAYDDLVSGSLDFMEQVPTSALAGDKWKSDLTDRAHSAPIPSTGIIAFPFYDKAFANAHLRKAFSLAIDRQTIATKIFFGSRTPATSWSNPLAPGGGKNDCTVCTFDPAQAKSELAAAGGWKGGTVVLTYNADSSHKEWMEAVANSIKNTLGINVQAQGVPTFAVFRDQIEAHSMKGPYRAGWQQDYPSVEDWIGPLYVTGGSSNDGQYSNPQVDALYKQGTSAASVDAANAKFAEATKVIDQDVPAIPIYNYEEQWGTSDRLTKAGVTNVGDLDLSTVEVSN